MGGSITGEWDTAAALSLCYGPGGAGHASPLAEAAGTCARVGRRVHACKAAKGRTLQWTHSNIQSDSGYERWHHPHEEGWLCCCACRPIRAHRDTTPALLYNMRGPELHLCGSHRPELRPNSTCMGMGHAPAHPCVFVPTPTTSACAREGSRWMRRGWFKETAAIVSPRRDGTAVAHVPLHTHMAGLPRADLPGADLPAEDLPGASRLHKACASYVGL